MGLLLVILLWPWPHEVDDILLGGESGPPEVVAWRGPAGGPGEALGPGPRGGAREATRAGVARPPVTLRRVQLVVSGTGGAWGCWSASGFTYASTGRLGPWGHCTVCPGACRQLLS